MRRLLVVTMLAACGARHARPLPKLHTVSNDLGCFHSEPVVLVRSRPEFKLGASPVEIAPDGGITGTVFDARREMLPGVVVWAEPRSFQGDPQMALTDELGRYRLDLAPGVYQLTLIYNDYEAVRVLGKVEVPRKYP